MVRMGRPYTQPWIRLKPESSDHHPLTCEAFGTDSFAEMSPVIPDERHLRNIKMTGNEIFL